MTRRPSYLDYFTDFYRFYKREEVGYQAPGVLHAYLGGQNIELMANSDNVLRGGLTPKYIDPTELMKHLDTDTSGQYLVPPLYLMDDEVAFAAPVKDFILKHFVVKKDNPKAIQFTTIAVLLLKQGELTVGDSMLPAGQSMVIPAYTYLTINTVSPIAEYFLAFSSI